MRRSTPPIHTTPPEKQVLEQQLEDDTHLKHQIHTTLQQEQHLADSAQTAGYPHPTTDDSAADSSDDTTSAPSSGDATVDNGDESGWVKVGGLTNRRSHSYNTSIQIFFDGLGNKRM